MNRLREFRDDERGVIMIVGVIMAAFLIGIVWFIWGIGRAAVFRENLQAAADATAYQVSVYDARGMNIIVMINLIMSVILTVLVVMRIVQVIVWAVNIVSCILALIGIGAPLCATTTSLESPIKTTVDTTAKIIHPILMSLSITESAISIMWPHLAAVMSTTAAAGFSQDVERGFAIGTSNMPFQGVLDLGSKLGLSFFNLSPDEGGKKVSLDNLKSSMKPGMKNGIFCNHGGKFFLPVESDSYENLCARAGANISHAISGVFSLFAMGTVIKDAIQSFFDDYVASTIGSLLRPMASFFCQDDSSALKDVGTILANLAGAGGKTDEKSLKAECKKKKEAAEAKKEDTETTTPGVSVVKEEATTAQAEYDTCIKAAESSSKKGDDGKTKLQWKEHCPKKLYGKAKMLDINFQNWGFAFGQYEDTSSDKVAIGNSDPKNPATIAPASTDGNMQVAQSEFYYEPKKETETMVEERADPGVSISTLTTQSGAENVMWNMRWRARLRRVRAPTIDFGSVVSNLVKSFLSGLAGKFVSKLVDDKISKDSTTGKIINGQTKGEAQAATGKYAGKVIDFLTSPLKGQTTEIFGSKVTSELVH